jgi:TRAP-type mannitol/chloroaromatic compound transport system substrate-binding protein
MQRRAFLTGAGAATVALGAGIKTAEAKPEHKWKMVTTWPKNFPGLGTGAENLATLIGEMSGGRIEVKVYGANELVPAFEVFDAVSQGTAEMGHGAAYYWKGKSEAAQFFSTVPFGLTAQEHERLASTTAAAWSCGPSSTPSSAWCRHRPATPACRWAAGSTRRSTPSATSRV